jgi:cell division protein FtsQ
MTGVAQRADPAGKPRGDVRRSGRLGSSIVLPASSTTIPTQRARSMPRLSLPRAPWTPRRVARAAVLVVVAAGCAVGVVKVRTVVEASPDILIRSVNVAGVAADSPRAAEILAYAGVAENAPFFAVEPEVVAARVARHPWIKTADVSRVPPDRLEIVVHERTALAVLRMDDGVYVVDDDGEIIKRARPDDALDLPLISLLPSGTAEMPSVANDDEQGSGRRRAAVSPRLMDALTLVRAVAGRNLGDRLSEVVELPAVGFELVLDDGARVRLGNDLFETKLRRLQATEEELRARGRRFSFMYLDDARHPERVAVRLRPATETTPAGG